MEKFLLFLGDKHVLSAQQKLFDSTAGEGCSENYQNWTFQPLLLLTKATDYLLLIFLGFNGSDAMESSSSPPPQGFGASRALGEQQSCCWKQ